MRKTYMTYSIASDYYNYYHCSQLICISAAIMTISSEDLKPRTSSNLIFSLVAWILDFEAVENVNYTKIMPIQS